MSWCKREFFGYEDESEDIWSTWNDTLIICPVIPENDGIQLADDGFQMVTKNIMINFDRC